ncbi:hypothetical protein [Anaerostipes caccae]|uniref:hypothetical protein n=1 Tax=Anaerostipes caccae TaxID=105841 RepID=UPI0038D38367
MKYKVGDKVRVKKILTDGTYYGMDTANEEMCELAGEIVTISRVREESYDIAEDDELYVWTDEMFQTSPKGLIEPGSIVECRSGNKFIYINGLFMHSDGWMFLGNRGLKDFSDNLIFLNGDKDFDIMRILESKARTLSGVFEPIYLTSIWERREPREMTLEEVEKELGYPVKIVKGE